MVSFRWGIGPGEGGSGECAVYAAITNNCQIRTHANKDVVLAHANVSMAGWQGGCYCSGLSSSSLWTPDWQHSHQLEYCLSPPQSRECAGVSNGFRKCLAGSHTAPPAHNPEAVAGGWVPPSARRQESGSWKHLLGRAYRHHSALGSSIPMDIISVMFQAGRLECLAK